MEHEVKSNRYGIKCLIINIILLWGILLFNEVDIFILDKFLLRYATFSITIMYSIVLVALRFIGLEKSWVKYIILTTQVLGVGLLYVFLSYHAVLWLALPFLMAATYPNKRVILYTYIVTVITILITSLVNYQYGLSDMNIVTFATGSLSKYGDEIRFKVEQLTFNKAQGILLYYALPRCAILGVFAIMSLVIANMSRDMYAYQEKVEKESKIDAMTGVYNKNYYLQAIKEEYSSMKHIGVIYFDLNNLKEINDTHGHDVGDRIIIKLAKSISYLLDEGIRAYRIGGDEFILIIENASGARINGLLGQWLKFLEIINSESEAEKVSVAYGYSYGDGKDIEKIIEEADKNMYQCKQDMKNKK